MQFKATKASGAITLLINSILNIQSAALFKNLNELQAQVAAAVSPLLMATEEGIAAESSIGHIKMRKIRKQDASKYLSDFYNGSSQSSVQFNGIDTYFNDTEDVFAQVNLYN